MAVACPVDLDTLKLRHEIQSIYARVATEPFGDFHFHRGPVYAAEMLGYDANALAALPAQATASFAGVANPHRIARMPTGATVVDIGCGAGMDLLLDLPVDSESVDVVISNGVLNLAPDKTQAFGEVFRILKPGGQFLYGDIVVASELSESLRSNIDLWTG